ncbi:GDSL esterase/lipase At4g10955 isoform X2 [Brachypodium distachyon]|nr:GDSL esterase/lipase At4g10955 isoform X2 [Brachypodium distachyon]XP_014754242.1 GDSL esterase/lipase At4g10955 isoform X2 [Brachypodium distachyon]XP_024315356.1 GDSL esterase/lipase At4g10955 isoform X2 [Brachypodium distachyon]|eukprot:XP_014754241.1 GDSL esterase/lipase At4g10955 isoform X2 [Brachypodium distachyon]
MGKMSSQKDLFEVSGPNYLTYVNWNCPHHRRSVMASLVQGVYVLERDRQWNRQGPDARAPAWWKFFHFELREALVDAADSSIFGAVYAFQPPYHLADPAATAGAPHYVVAFRGTITKKGSAYRDLELDLQLVRNGLEHTSRFRAAMQTIHNVVAWAGAGHGRVWLAGHSLGSAISTLGGKAMARAGVVLTTFLFNAPFLSAPVEKIPHKGMKQGIRIAKSFVTAGVATVLQKGTGGGEDAFAALARWVPHVLVNPADPISAEYVGYFGHRKKMEDIGAGAVGRLATRNSVRDLLLGIGKAGGCEPLHLFPSAVLTVNRGPSPDFKTAHGIHQWWSPDLALECSAYSYA